MTNGEAQEDQTEDRMIVKSRRLELPEESLPTFDGSFENWLLFKNAFRNMVDSRTDLSDVDKLYCLKSALVGEAANKTKIFATDGIDYFKAWELLERSYEVKRILISLHLSLIMNMKTLEKETAAGLSKLANDAQKHVASLKALGVSVTPEIIVHILESKLPKTAIDRWEANLDRNEFPEPDQIYEFLYKSAMRASNANDQRSQIQRKRQVNHQKEGGRFSSNRAFLLNASRSCIACKAKRHPLYMCDKFKKLPIPKRIELIKAAKVCYNCLRSHRDYPCKFSNCTICQKRHNTLLHLENYPTTSKSNIAKPETTQRD
ncbi:hypothetical protein ALC62_05792 [Cyphomyrmex costatus]|uniref:Gag-Pol polyprotein n=1 Tax=Cyphomyrmex costatus TaxID=456900 RepID=A0A195CRY4_9HYME|nr:hypothetical protein ALC62_05792 [Cyphomyrmex costatus]